MLKTFSRWTSRFTSGTTALSDDQSTIIDTEGRTEDIRAAMLHAVSQVHRRPGTTSARTSLDILRANDIQTLWYLRSDVFHLLADSYGEQSARHKLYEITEMFRGLVPKSQMPMLWRDTPKGDTPRT